MIDVYGRTGHGGGASPIARSTAQVQLYLGHGRQRCVAQRPAHTIDDAFDAPIDADIVDAGVGDLFVVECNHAPLLARLAQTEQTQK